MQQQIYKVHTPEVQTTSLAEKIRDISEFNEQKSHSLAEEYAK